MIPFLFLTYFYLQTLSSKIVKSGFSYKHKNVMLFCLVTEQHNIFFFKMRRLNKTPI